MCNAVQHCFGLLAVANLLEWLQSKILRKVFPEDGVPIRVEYHLYLEWDSQQGMMIKCPEILIYWWANE